MSFDNPFLKSIKARIKGLHKAPIGYTFTGRSHVSNNLPLHVQFNWNMPSNWNQRVYRIKAIFLTQGASVEHGAQFPCMSLLWRDNLSKCIGTKSSHARSEKEMRVGY